MKTDLYWIESPTPGRLAVMPRPRGGDWLADEVRAWRAAGVNVVLSLLTSTEVGNFDLTQEGALCQAEGMEFLTFPITDRTAPTSKLALSKLLKNLATRLEAGTNIAIHCRQGLGRAPLVAICILLLAGLDPETASSRVSVARGCLVPETAEQERWIAEFAKEFTALAPK